ncbi:MAG TPA: PAS domain S-box protein [bacterium]|nr:PAS domain S-box protein [bacterium]
MSTNSKESNDAPGKKVKTDAARRERFLAALTAVREISLRATESEGLDGLMNFALDRVAELAGADAGAIYLYDPKSRVGRLAALYNVPEELIGLADGMKAGEFALGRAFESGDSYCCPDLKEISGSDLGMAGAGYLSCMIAPLRIPEGSRKSRVLGAIAVGWKKTHAYDENTLGLVEAVSSQVALVMENLRLSLERGQMLSNLKRTVNTFMDFIEHTPSGLVLLKGARIVYGNPAALRMMGGKDEVINREFIELVAPEDHGRILETWNRYCARTEFVQHAQVKVVRRGDGKRLSLDCSISEVEVEGGEPMVAVSLRDVTDRVESEQKLQASENKYRLLVELAHQGIIAMDPAGTITFVNQRAGEILGYPPAELLGASILKLVDEDWAPVARELFLKGRDIPVEQEEISFRQKDGSALECMINSGPAFDELNRMQGHTIFINDLTEQKNLREQLRNADKMMAVGRLAGGVAHEFNNINAAIQGYVELMLKQKHLAGQDREDLEAIRALIRRASHITQQLLVFARREVIQKELIDLRGLVDINVKIVKKEYATEGIDVSVKHHCDLPLLTLDAGRIGQVLVHLIMNARDAVVERGEEKRIEVETGLDEDWIFIRVRDTGPGISVEDQQRIFEPFYTTKGALGGSPVPGTGLGLSVAHSIIKEHDGHIEVESAPGQGAAFTFWLPAPGAGRPARTRNTAHGPVAVGARVLIVDDEISVNRMLERALQNGGYQVETALSGKEGLKKLQSGRYDVILVDLQMPDVRGEVLLEEAALLPAKMRPASIIISGKAHVGELADYEHLGVEAIVKKPFSLETLFNCIYNACTRKRERKPKKGALYDRALQESD